MGLEGEPTTLPRPDSRPPGRWSLRWPVLPVAGPNSRAAEWGFRPLSDTHWPSHDARRWSVRSDAAAIQAAPMQQLALSFLCSRHCSCRRSLFRLPVGVNVPGLSMFVGRFSGDHHWPVLGDRRGCWEAFPRWVRYERLRLWPPPIRHTGSEPSGSSGVIAVWPW